jgi:hypothetical protein
VLEYLVAAQKIVVLLYILVEAAAELEDLGCHARRQIGKHAAGPHVVEHHACAGYALEDVHEVLAIAHRIQELPHGTGVQAESAEPHQMTGDSVDLREQHAQVVGLRRDRYLHELLDSQRRGEFAMDARNVVAAIHERAERVVLTVFGELLDAARDGCRPVAARDDGYPRGRAFPPRSLCRGRRSPVAHLLKGADHR